MNSSSASDEYNTDQDSQSLSSSVWFKTHTKSSKNSKKDRIVLQKYRPEWEKTLTWVAPSPMGSHFTRCKICNKDLQGSYTQIKRHSTRRTHLQRVAESIPKNKSIFDVAKKSNSIIKNVKEAEIRLGLFLIEHNLPMNISDHFIEFLQTFAQENGSIILKKMKAKRTKVSMIVKNVIGKYCHQENMEILKSHKFALLIDESTDRTTKKTLVLIARVVIDYEPKDVFIAMLELEDSTTHSIIYRKLVQFFEENNVPYKQNLISFASDGANVLMGKHNSVSSLFKKDIPHLFIWKCICHSLALCISQATEKIPPCTEEMVRQIINYFKYSSIRNAKYQQIQLKMGIKKHKLLKLCKTRWLSMNEVIDRILEQEAALKIYFQEEAKGSTEAQSILQKLERHLNILYLKFLKYVLPIVTKRNLLFQAERSQITQIHNEMSIMVLELLQMYLKPDVIEHYKLSNMPYKNPDKFLDDSQIYIGPLAAADIALNILKSTEVTSFYRICRNFLVELVDQIYLRFPFHEKVIQGLEHIKFVDPLFFKESVSVAPAYAFFSYNNNLFNNVNCSDLDREFRTCKLMMKDSTEITIKTFWNKVSKVQDGNNNPKYSLLLNFVKYILTLPHSSAACERWFSQQNLNKTNIRNNLNTDTLNGILLGKSMLNLSNKSCYDFVINPKLTILHNENMYDHKTGSNDGED